MKVNFSTLLSNNYQENNKKSKNPSFGIMYKHQFSGIDRYVVENNNLPLDKFNRMDDFQIFCNKLIDKIRNKKYPGLDKQTEKKRNIIINGWYTFTNKMNPKWSIYTNSTLYMMLDSLTKGLKADNNNVPPIVNMDVMNYTTQNIQKQLAINPFAKVDYSQQYSKDLIEYKQKTIEKILKRFDKGIQNYSTPEILSAFGIKSKMDKDGMLIVSEYREPYSDVTFDDIGVDEKALLKQIKEVEGNANFIYSKAEDLGNIRKIGGNATFYASNIKDLGKLEEIDGDALFNDSDLEKLGNLRIVKGSAVFNNSEVESLGKLESIGGTLGLNDSKVKDMGALKEVGGNAIFSKSQVTDLKGLEKIGGVADFRFSNVVDTGALREIGIQAIFMQSKIRDLGNIEKIDGDAIFKMSKVTSLGKLKEIGRDAWFMGSRIKRIPTDLKIAGDIYPNGYLQSITLMPAVSETINIAKPASVSTEEQLKQNEKEEVLKLAKMVVNERFPKGINNYQIKEVLDFFGIEAKRNENGQLILSEFKSPDKNITYTELGINENDLFKQVAAISGDADFSMSDVTDLGRLVKIGGSANFSNSKVTNLGDLRFIGKDAYFRNSRITDLNKLEEIGGNASFPGSNVENLGNLRTIKGDGNFSWTTKLKDLGNLAYIGGMADFRDSSVESLGKLRAIGGLAYFDASKVKNLGELEEIGGEAYFYSDLYGGSELKDLGKLRKIGGRVSFWGSDIVDLGNLQEVGGDVWFKNSLITDMKNLYKVGGTIYIDEVTKGNITNWGHIDDGITTV